MPTEIGGEEVRIFVENGAQLVEVLSARQYEELHLAGAVNIPLAELDQKITTRLRQDQAIIVYCFDYQWDLSARAAWRLESLGFSQVFRYTAGKADWTANGLPSAGKLAQAPCVGDLARRDVPTCQLRESIAEVRQRLQVTGWNVSVVVNDLGIVFGLVREGALTGEPQTSVEQVMEGSPRTYRLNAAPEKAAEYMRRQGVDSVLVTTSSGKLVGLLKREDAERPAPAHFLNRQE